MEADPYEQANLILTPFFNTAELTVGIVFELFILLCLLCMSALISGSEVAYFSLSPAHINQLNESKSKKDRMVLKLLNVPEKLLATILIANNFINIAIVMISAFITDGLFNFSDQPGWIGFVIQVVAVTFMLIMFGEILPKIYANRFALRFSYFMAAPLKILNRVLWPLSKLLILSTSIVNKRLSKKNQNLSINDLTDAIELTADADSEEEKILKRIVKFGSIEVKEIMRSRIDVVAIEVNQKINEILPVIIENGYSRMPVFEETFDNIKGILYIKDLLPHLDKNENFEWQKLVRQAYFVPETKKIDDLLSEFQENKIHMAIVVDEYGGTQGIVTLEDVLEEVVGEIIDEDDEEETFYTKLDPDNYLFEAKIQLNDFYKVVEVENDIFNEIKGEAETLAGVILEMKGEFPRKKQKISFKQFVFTIEEVDQRRIKTIKVTINRKAREIIENGNKKN